VSPAVGAEDKRRCSGKAAGKCCLSSGCPGQQKGGSRPTGQKWLLTQGVTDALLVVAVPPNLVLSRLEACPELWVLQPSACTSDTDSTTSPCHLLVSRFPFCTAA